MSRVPFGAWCLAPGSCLPRPGLVYGLPMWKWKLFVPGPKTPTTTTPHYPHPALSIQNMC